jgi:PAS domain S-box-containing protein
MTSAEKFNGTASDKEMEMNKTEVLNTAGKSKHHKEKLEEIEEQYSTLVEHIVEGVLIVQDKIIKFANRRVAEMSGYTIKELIGMPIFNLVTSGSMPELSDRLARRERNEPVSEVFQTEMLCKDRTVRQLETSGKMFKYEGKPALIAAGRDITKRKIAEEKLERILESLKNRFGQLFKCWHLLWKAETLIQQVISPVPPIWPAPLPKRWAWSRISLKE